MKLVIEFNGLQGAKVPGGRLPDFLPEFREIMPFIPDGYPPEDMLNFIEQKIEIYEAENGSLNGIYTHPYWGEGEAFDILLTPCCLCFAGRAGNDDKGAEIAYFDFVLALNEGSNHVMGLSGGRKPFFIGYMVQDGFIIERELYNRVQKNMEYLRS